MAVLSKQHKILTVSIVILLDDEKFHKEKKIQEILASNCLKKGNGMELEIFDLEYFFQLLGMSPDQCEYLLLIDGPKCNVKGFILWANITKQTLNSLQYLESGESHQFLSFAFRISHTAISNILADTCEKIDWKTSSDTSLVHLFQKWIDLASVMIFGIWSIVLAEFSK